MTTEVYQLLCQLLIGKTPSDLVFTRADSAPVRDFRGTWWALCEKAGLGTWEKDGNGKTRWKGLLFHDLRRSAVRNMIRSSVSEKMAMTISGHKTRSVFDRYDILTPPIWHNAAAKIEEARQRSVEKPTATTTATATEAENDGQGSVVDLQYLQ